MANLTAKQESFIKLMTESEELARRGFGLLLRRPDYERFFDPLRDAGLFDASHNPAPVPAEEEGYVRIQYWSALDYLSAVAKMSGEREDMELATKVMMVVRSVAGWRDANGLPRENYHTAHKFTAIFGLVPTAAVAVEDLKFIPLWLSNRFERMLVGNALDEGALTRFLSSGSREDWDKAVAILRHCTVIEWRPREGFGGPERSPATAVDDYWLRRLIDHHAVAFGEKVGNKAAEVFAERTREVFGGSDTRRLHSYLYRPAIEGHAQNHEWHGAENCMVEGLRDVLLSWCTHDPATAKLFIEELLAADEEILRRVGLYVLGQRWPALRDLYPKFLGPGLFDFGHLHELYDLISVHFADLTDAGKADTLEAIRRIPLPTRGDDPARLLKKIQQRWLSAIVGKNYLPADEWFDQLKSDQTLGGVPEHPDFASYMEGWSGPGASPYSAAEIVAFAAAGVAVEKLNAFEERDPFRGPTMDGLTMALENAARTAPNSFLEVLTDFLLARPRFQYSVLAGLKGAWEATERNKETDWNRGWQAMIAFFENLIGGPDSSQAGDSEGSRIEMVVTIIADCLQSGTNKDDHAYSPELLPRTQAVIAKLLEKASAAEKPSDDPMSQALNTPKGRVIEALFSQALRVCRVSDAASGSHEEQWNTIRPLFDAELDKCRDANYEFSTLSAAYIQNLSYMDPKWIEEHVAQVFPSEFPRNSICAIGGLGYASFSRPLYKLLADRGIVDRALGYELKGRGGKEKLLERIAAGYLWGDETLQSPRFSHLFEPGNVEDLETVTRVFWMVRGGAVSNEQRERILQYWERCIAWSRQFPNPPKSLLSSLGLLSCYVAAADGRERGLMEAVAPYVHVGYNGYEFVNQLKRLVETSPDGVSAVFGKMIKAGVPDFDYEDQLKTLLRALADKGRKQDVISHAEVLRSLPGMQELFDELTRGN